MNKGIKGAFLIRSLSYWRFWLFPKVFTEGNESSRAAFWLSELEHPWTSLRYRTAIARIEYIDLLMDEAATREPGLELQARIFDLAAQGEPWAKQILRRRMGYAPITKLFIVICCQALTDRSRRIRVTFRESRYSSVDFEKEQEWHNAIEIPSKLNDRFLGFMRLVGRVGLEGLRPLVHEDLAALNSMEIIEDGTVLEIRLN